MDTIEEEGASKSTGEVFVPGTALKEGEELVHDSSTYHMYHVVSYAGMNTILSLYLDILLLLFQRLKLELHV